MQTYLNETGVPLSVAVYLAADHYDHLPGVFSATALMKSVRQQVLPRRIEPGTRDSQVDVLNVVKSRLGTSIHDGLERAWQKENYTKALLSLGHPQHIIDRIVVNPEGPIAADAIPVYMEIRSFGEIDGRKISGKFDFVAEGRLEDFKSTSTFTWVKETKTKDYMIQGSIYRWLNQDIITEDHIAIQFFFMDWMQGRAKADPAYPQRQVEEQRIPLMSLDDTEDYMRTKLNLFEQYKDSPEHELPGCTDYELWRKEPQFKYYKNPLKRARSTKNFDTLEEAETRCVADGSVGVVVTIPGEVMACNYCAAAPICSQRDALIADGSLII
jgi:hypothetical protein